MPEVSIIIPYYKKKKYIKKTINSIINQNYKNKYEILLIYDDNNNQDLKYLKKNFKKINNFRIINNKDNIGVARSRNLGIKKSKGTYCAFLDADDTWNKNKLRYQLNYMKKNGYLFTFTGYVKKKKMRKIFVSSKKKKISYNDLLKECVIGLSTVIIKKNIIPKNLFPITKTQEDLGAWLKLTKKGISAYYLNKYLSQWNFTSYSLSSNTIQKLNDLKKIISMQNISIYNKFISFFLIIFNSISRKIYNI